MEQKRDVLCACWFDPQCSCRLKRHLQRRHSNPTLPPHVVQGHAALFFVKTTPVGGGTHVANLEGHERMGWVQVVGHGLRLRTTIQWLLRPRVRHFPTVFRLFQGVWSI
jgi:hypothetical protein